MTRTDADSWELASRVGATATMVAAAPALTATTSSDSANGFEFPDDETMAIFGDLSYVSAVLR